MTSPPIEHDVECPNCAHQFRAWLRASINLSLGEEWTDEDIERATTAVCPQCGQRSGIDVLIVNW